jgi:enoyl-[acyl-carrier protein] reductase I
VANARVIYNFQKRSAPLRRTVSIDEIGNTAIYLLSELGAAVTGAVQFVDTGFNIVAMPPGAEDDLPQELVRAPTPAPAS